MLFAVYLTLLFTACQGLTDEEIALFTSNFTPTEQAPVSKNVLFVVDNEDGSVTVTTNGVPSHATDGDAPESWNSFTMFKEPIMRPEGQEMKCLPYGPIGVSVSGAYIYSWWGQESGCQYAAQSTLQADQCEGRSEPNNEYHYRTFSPCVQTPVCGVESPIFGVALDGIPIFGPIADNGRHLTRIDLDECGGRYDSQGRYKYHVTPDPPYFPSCFKGYLRKDVGRPSSDFTCSCPYTDAANGASICDFAGDVNQPAACEDIIPEHSTLSRTWEQVQELVFMAGCCPEGQDCGSTCLDNEDCVIERRRVGVFTNVPIKVSCWEACYEDCSRTIGCNCKRSCRRECLGRNWSSRVRREVVKRGASCKNNNSDG